MASPKPTRVNPALRYAFLRQLHVYVSVFVAPSLLFFAVTGALQTFRIPDRPGAPPLLVKLARVHKDDVFAPKPMRAPRPAGGDADGGGHKRHGGAGAEDASKAPAPQPAKAAPKPATTVLKWFFSLVSIGIAITTLFGLWMALAYNRRKLVILGVLLAGAIAPVLILMAAV